MNNLVIIGTSSTAKDIYGFVCRHQLYKVLGFAVDREYKAQDTFLDLPVFEIENLSSQINKEEDYIFVAMQWNRLNADRKYVYEKMKKQGYKFANIVSPNANLSSQITGENCWISDLACLDFRVQVGNNVYIKSGALVGSGSKIADHCFIGAHSSVGGATRIGEQSFVGLGATIFDKVEVGKKCIVGAATALKRNLPDFSVYKSNVENFIVKTYPEDVIESKLMFSKNVR